MTKIWCHCQKQFCFFTSSLLQFFDPLCSFLFLVILNLSLNCFQFKRILLSAMAMAMSIYRTLCVLVSLTISLQEMLIAFDNEIRFQSIRFQKTWNRISENMKSDFRNHFSEIRLQTSMLEMSLANRFKNLYRGQLFIFCLRRRRRFFYLKISLLEMLIAVGNEHLKTDTHTHKNKSCLSKSMQQCKSMQINATMQ